MFSKTFQASHMTYIIKSRFVCFAWTAVHEVLFPYSEKAQCFMLKSYIQNTLLPALFTELRELQHNQCYKVTYYGFVSTHTVDVQREVQSPALRGETPVPRTHRRSAAQKAAQRKRTW